jgi:hypothetical protein
MNKPRNHRREEAAIRSCEVHVTIRLPKGKRISVVKALDSLLDALGGGTEHVDAIFIRFVRGAGKGGAW